MRRSLYVLAALTVGFVAPPANDSVFLGVVSSASPEATASGRRVLESGGNAIDAAVAVSFTLGVTEPAMSGLGGQTQIVLYSDETGGVVINGSSISPRATPHRAVERDLVGRRASTVPTTVKVLDYAHRRYGSGRVSWAELLEPAIEAAENGFDVGAFRRRVYARAEARLAEDPETLRLFALPSAGAFRQPVLAATLRQIASNGADDFYQGAIARAIAADMERNGGWIRYEDLAGLPEPVELAPLRSLYRDYEVLTLPPPGGGWVVLQMLELLERTEPASLAPETAGRAEALARALFIGHRERRVNPVHDLRDYTGAVDERLAEATIDRLLSDAGSERGETTHFSVVDASGLAVSVTASINAYYGAKVASAELGFLYNDYMNEFVLDQPGHPFALRPAAMPYSSMSPTILIKDARARLVLGSPGSARILSAVTQVAQLWVDHEMPLADAVAYPRLHVRPGRELFVESRSRLGVPIDALVDAGFIPTDPADDLENQHGNPFFGGVHAVAFEDGAWVGAADPRRDGRAVVVEAIP